MRIISILIISVFITGQACSTNNPHDNFADEAHVSDHTGEKEADSDHTAGNKGAEHSILKLKRQSFSFVIKTGGRIMVDAGDIENITARSSGIVMFNDHFLFPGVRTIKGQNLFTLTGNNLADDNTELKFSQVKADLEKAKANYERAGLLIADKIITQEHFLSVKNEYDKVLNEYNNLNALFGKGGNIVSSPGNGYIREIFVIEGQKVVSGQQLATIAVEHNLVLKADLSPYNLDALSFVEKANFTVGYSDRLFKTDKMNGKKISSGKSTGENSYYIPVYFRIDYDPELIEGTFSEVFLIGKEIKDAIVIPNTSLMEEYGKIYVFVEDEDGDFLKRYIKTGYNDGESTQVLEGLNEGENIVSSGAYNIRLAQMTNSAPAHSHNH